MLEVDGASVMLVSVLLALPVRQTLLQQHVTH